MATKATTTKRSTTTKSKPAKTTTSKTVSKTKTPAKKDAAKELKDLFEDSLKDIYWAEKALVKALQSDEVKDYINATFDGAVVPIF